MVERLCSVKFAKSSNPALKRLARELKASVAKSHAASSVGASASGGRPTTPHSPSTNPTPSSRGRMTPGSTFFTAAANLAIRPSTKADRSKATSNTGRNSTGSSPRRTTME